MPEDLITDLEEWAREQIFLAADLLFEGSLEQAERTCQAALDVRPRLRDFPWGWPLRVHGSTLWQLGLHHEDRRREAAARKYYLKAKEAYLAGLRLGRSGCRDVDDYARLFLHLSVVYNRIGAQAYNRVEFERNTQNDLPADVVEEALAFNHKECTALRCALAAWDWEASPDAGLYVHFRLGAAVFASFELRGRRSLALVDEAVVHLEKALLLPDAEQFVELCVRRLHSLADMWRSILHIELL